MKKRKVLFINPSLCQGGIEHYQIQMLNMLDKEKFDITLFQYLDDITLLPLVPEGVKVIIDKDENHYHRKLRAIGLHIKKKLCTALGFNKLSKKYEELLREYIHDQKMMHPARDIFSREKFDVVVANAVGRAMEIALNISADKYFVFFHSSLDLHHDLLEKLFPKFDGIVAVSPGVREMLRESYPEVKEKILLLENYVDAQNILEKAKKHSEYEFKNNEIMICSCGRLSLEKGFDLAVETARILNEKKYRFKWYFIGDGVERKRLEKEIARYSLEKQIIITGYMDNPFRVMKLCDIYVQPSYEESYGRTIKEAIILGCPVVSTSTVGGKTLIKDRKNGILTEISAEGLANGIELFLQDEVLRKKCKDAYSIEQNEQERELFRKGLEEILS